MIEVRLFAHFRNGREKISFLPAESFPSPKKIIGHLDIPEEDLAIILINGFHSEIDDLLKAGDVLALFPPVGGG